MIIKAKHYRCLNTFYCPSDFDDEQVDGEWQKVFSASKLSQMRICKSLLCVGERGFFKARKDQFQSKYYAEIIQNFVQLPLSLEISPFTLSIYRKRVFEYLFNAIACRAMLIPLEPKEKLKVFHFESQFS